ncbi:trypsin-like peptidase domain-containing protein [Streptomyces mexicanus]|uniref:trypsin-like peptidase domain-containing protein n=1 Tax=Streptomyces mexicanus TaxID=178566 RepID=UPI0036CB1F9C
MRPATDPGHTGELRWSVVRLSTPFGHAVGGGVLLDRRHVLTCAHVVTAAVDGREGDGPPPDGALRVAFPGVAGEELFSASVVGWSDPDRADAALLDVPDVPETARPAVLAEPVHTVGHAFYTIGFPPSYGQTGRMAHGRLLHAGLDGRIAMTADTGPRVVGGFSGCPVWDEDAGGVVGIVAEEDLEAEARTSHCLTLAEARTGLGAAWRRLDLTSAPADVAVSYLEESAPWADWCAQVLRQAGHSVRQLPWEPERQPDLVTELTGCARHAPTVLVVLNDRYLLRAGGRDAWYAAYEAACARGAGALVALSYGPQRLEPPPVTAGHVRVDPRHGEAADVSTLAASLLQIVAEARLPAFPPPPSAAPGGFPLLPPERQRLRVQHQVQSAARARARSGHAPGDSGCRVVGDRVSGQAEGFRDRVSQQRDLGRLIADPSVGVVSVIGARGIGKSALAARVLSGLEIGKWPAEVDGPPVTAIVSLSTRAGAREISLERIVVTCAQLADAERGEALLRAWTRQAPLEERLDALRAVLAEQRTVLLLDNLEDALGPQGEALDPELAAFLELCRSRPGLLTAVITSTTTPWLPSGPGTGHVRLDLRQGLPGRDGVDLLRHLDHTPDLRLREADTTELIDIVSSVYGSPRALQLFAAVLQMDTTATPAALCTLLQNAEDPLVSLVSETYRRLDLESRSVLEALAVFGRPVPREAVEQVLHQRAPGTRSDLVMDRLRLASLIGYDRTTKRFELHPFDADLIRGYLERDHPADLRALHAEAARWYAQQRPSTLRYLQDADPLLLRFRHLVRAGERESAARLLLELTDFLQRQGYPKRIPSLHRELGDEVSDPGLRLALRRGLALSYVITGPVQVAAEHLWDWHALAERQGDRSMLADALGQLADLYRFTGEFAQALDAVERSYPINVELGNRVAQTHDLLRIGLISLAAGNPPRAWQAVQQLSALAEYEPGARQRLLDLRSLAHLAAGDAAAALRDAEASAEGYLAAGEKYDVPYAHNEMGLAHLLLGALADALHDFDTARLEAAAGDSARVSALCDFNAAWVLYELGHIERGRQRAERAADTFRQVHAYGSTLARDDVTAARHLCEALAAAADDDDAMAARHLLAAARSARRNPDLVPAKVLAARARELAERSGHRDVVDEARRLYDGS